MEPQTRIDQLGGEVHRLEQALEAGRLAGQRTNRVVTVFSVALSLTFVGFLLVNYFHLSSEWTEEHFSRSLEREVEALSPTALREINVLGRDLLPVYAEEGRKQLLAMGPQMARNFEVQMDELCQEILGSVHEQMLQTQEQVLGRAEEVLAKHFPSLHRPDERELLGKKFQDMTEDALATAMSRFEKRFSGDVEGLRKSVLKLDVSDTGEPTVELQKEFIHLWLKLLDQEIMEL